MNVARGVGGGETGTKVRFVVVYGGTLWAGGIGVVGGGCWMME